MIFIFTTRVTISDHTPYNFSHANGDLSMYFNIKTTHSKTLARLSKCVGCCQKKTAKRKEGANSKDLFAVAVMTGELIVGRKNFSQFA